MRIENNLTVVTPAEADYLETICMYREDDEAATALKWRFREAQLNWALSVLPPHKIHQGHDLGFAFTKAEALQQYEGSTEEVIRIRLTDNDVRLVKRLAVEKTAAILERAEHFEDICNQSAHQQLELGDGSLSKEEDEMFKADIFKHDLKYLAIGYCVLNILLNE